MASKVDLVHAALPYLLPEQAEELLLIIITLADGYQALPNLNALYTGSLQGDESRMASRRASIAMVVRAWGPPSVDRPLSPVPQEQLNLHRLARHTRSAGVTWPDGAARNPRWECFYTWYTTPQIPRRVLHPGGHLGITCT